MKVSLKKEKIKITLLENISQKAVRLFQDAGYSTIECIAAAPSPLELRELLKDTHILGIRSRTQITPEILAAAPKLFAIGCFCIGTNQVSLDEASLHAIPVFNAPFSNTRSVAELTLSSIIALMRNIPEKNAGAHSGAWDKSATDAHEVRGKTLGIVGYGNIGSQLSVLAHGLGMRVIFYDIAKKLPLGNAEPMPSLDTLLAQSDVVTFHVPETTHTAHMLNADTLAKCKAGARIINYARGSVIDIDALVEALQRGHIRGAAIDVFPQEPGGNSEEFLSPLRAFPQVLLSPHVGGSTEEAQENIGIEVAEKLITYSDNGSTSSAVNFPEVTLPPHPHAHRILNVHKNVPGVLRSINTICADAGANIVGQFLQTRGDMGYVVTDIEHIDSIIDIQQRIQAVDGAVRTRLLH